MHTKRFLAGATAGVAALALIGACAKQVQRLEPGLELKAAAQHLADAKQAGFTLKFTGSADALITAAKQDAAKDKDADAWTDDDSKSLRTVLNSSITVAYDQGGTGPDDYRMRLAATVDGVEGTELRVVGKTLYVKAPVNQLAQKFGGTADDIASARKDATRTSPEFGAFFDGGWVSLDTKDASKLPGQAFLGTPTPTTGNAKTLAEVKTSAGNLFKGAKVTRDSADPKHLIVTSSTTKAFAELKRLVTAVSGSQAKEMSEAFAKPPKDRPIVLDLWVDNEKLTAVEVNVLQFIDGASGRAALRLDMTTGEPIEAPAGATKINTKALNGLVAGPVEDGAASGGGTDGLDVTDTAQMLGFEAIGYAAQKGGKPADYLKASAADMPPSLGTARIVRQGVAEVTAHGAKACVNVSGSHTKEPAVTKGAC